MKKKYKIKIRCLLFLLLFALYGSSLAQGIRMHYEEMTNTERVDLVAAYWALGGPTGTNANYLNYDIAKFHYDNFNDIHFSLEANDVFFAWHRQASHELERAMKGTVGNEWITIPYWDWTISNLKTDLLWGLDWLGPFNTAWSLGRDAATNVTLPNKGAIANALLEPDFYMFSYNEVETQPLHFAAHGWTGGIMNGPISPQDPAFFFHHNMVDKIWADWYDSNPPCLGGCYTKITMARYDGTYTPPGSTLLPAIDPESIVDPRSLGIFYAEAGLAVLDKYTVKNTTNLNNNIIPSEKFGYQYRIEAKDNFLVPSGKDAEFRSCNEIELLPGFEAALGSDFQASIDTDCNFSTTPFAPNKKDIVAKREGQEETNPLVSSFLSFPNPFQEQTNIQYTLAEDSEVSIEVFNMTGQKIRTLTENYKQVKGVHNLLFDANDLHAGIYYCTLINGIGEVQTIKLIISR